jgi:predicted dithiol-disulfide oxidoreductase (DUF899 family)
MPTKQPPHPRIVSREEWLAKRRWHLLEEKRITKERDRVSAERRRLPMVKVDKEYVFNGSRGRQGLRDLFAGRRQLIVYHFMFDPKWRDGCPGCTGYVDALGDLSMLNERHTTFVLVSRAPLPKLRAYQRKRGWKDITWVSSFGSDFNYDFHATLDEKVAPIEFNFRTKEQLRAHRGPNELEGETHGLSVFFRVGRDVFHTYSAFARGVESVTDAYSLLDRTPWGRQEDWEDSPKGWPQKPTYG